MSMIINGIYYKDGEKPQGKSVNSQYKRWHIDRQREDHAKDIIQAHKNGKPSGDFIREYPEEAKRYFTEDQIRNYGNNY